MLKVDLGLLAREHRIRVDEEIPVEDPILDRAGVRFQGPVRLGLEVQQAAHDVVARGRMHGVAEMMCRRCTTPVRYDLDEELTLVFRPGLDPVEAEASEVYTLPPRATELDLAPAVREHVLLAVPEFVNCVDTCRGFCPQCGTNLNESSCECVTVDEDPRWTALRRLRSE
jgi:uncharacterized protein